jgi:protoporphyrinogen oxidase
MDALGEEIRKRGGNIFLNASVESLIVEDEIAKGIVVNGEKRIYDAIISTIPLPAFLRLIPESVQGPYWNHLRNIDSIGVVCVFLRTTMPFSKYFWINISDPRIELAGVIEYTNLNPLSHLGGDSIIYLPQYLPSQVEKFSKPNNEIINEYVGYLKIINPLFDHQYIKEAFVFREKYAQPICEVGFTRDMPEMRTPLHGLYLTDSSQLHPDDRTISNSLGLGKKVAALFQ